MSLVPSYTFKHDPRLAAISLQKLDRFGRLEERLRLRVECEASFTLVTGDVCQMAKQGRLLHELLTNQGLNLLTPGEALLVIHLSAAILILTCMESRLQPVVARKPPKGGTPYGPRVAGRQNENC